MKLNCRLLFLGLLLGFSLCVVGQKTDLADLTKLAEVKRWYSNGENNFADEHYNLALPFFLKVDSFLNDETNANIAYKIGICYLNSSSKKNVALPYLERAARNVAPVDEESSASMRQKSAPIDAYYQLAHAYHLNYKFDLAIDMYLKFKSNLDETEANMVNEVNRQIEFCNNAKELTNLPIDITVKNLGNTINSIYDDYAPVFPADESMLYFTSRRPTTLGGKTDADGKYFEDIYYSRKKDSLWLPAENIGEPINTNGNEASVGMSIDGQKMILYKDDKGDGNLYTAEQIGGAWAAPTKMNENINTPGWEPSGSLSADGSMFYFSSNRPGGFGGRDIYCSKLLPNGQWGKPINLGPTINTPYDEDSPVIHPDGVTLFFSSNGHKSMGGFDIFFSIRESDTAQWLPPINIGFPVNSPDDDMFYMPSADNKRAYYTSSKEGGFGEKDIYMITFPEQKEAKLTVFRGQILQRDGSVLKNVIIYVNDNLTGQLIGTYIPNAANGKYLFILPPGGDFNISYQAEGYLIQSEHLIVPKDSTYNIINTSIELKPISAGERVVLKNVFFESKPKLALKPTSFLELNKLVQELKDNPQLMVEIAGHLAGVESDKSLLKESKERAKLIVAYLVKHGIEDKRLLAVGYGATKPFGEGSKLNNRMEYRIVDAEGNYKALDQLKKNTNQ